MSSANVCTSTRDLSREMWFAEKIALASGESFCGLFAGTTDPPTRAVRARKLILAHKLATVRVVANRPDNFADCYLRLYGEPLCQEDPTPSHSLPPKQQDLL